MAPRGQPLQLRRQQQWQRQWCRAEGGSGGSAPGQPSRDEVLARINKARQYKMADSEAPPAGQQAGAAAGPPAPTSSVEQAFDAAAQDLAAKDEASFLQAVAQASSSPSSSSSSSAAPPPAAPSSGGGALGSAEATLARIKAAQQYKQQPAASMQPGGGGSSGATASAAPAPPPPPPPAVAADAGDADVQRSFRTGGGGSEQAANWLRFAEGSGAAAAALDQGLSAEQFTLAKEELKKQQEVEIISVDAGYAAGVQRAKRQAQGGQEGGEGAAEDVHNPKVATWGVSGGGAAPRAGMRVPGAAPPPAQLPNPALLLPSRPPPHHTTPQQVFPRPRNISEAYGG